MRALPEEYARGAVQLRYDDTFGAIDDEGAARRHVRNGTEIHILNHGVEILVFGVGTI